jgi:hypothetical protein
MFVSSFICEKERGFDDLGKERRECFRKEDEGRDRR